MSLFSDILFTNCLMQKLISDLIKNKNNTIYYRNLDSISTGAYYLYKMTSVCGYHSVYVEITEIYICTVCLVYKFLNHHVFYSLLFVLMHKPDFHSYS